MLNQAVKRNLGRFPADFMLQLAAEEWASLRSQAVTSNPPRDGMRSQFVTASRRNVNASPYAFTEQGIAMLSNRVLARKIEAMEKKYDEQFTVVFDAIKRLIAENEAGKAQPKRRIGFTS